MLELDEHGEGTATLLRRTSAIFAVDGDVVVVATEEGAPDQEQFEMSLRCNGRQFGCETYDFDALCLLDGDVLRCEAPEWYHDPNWIEFHPVD
ncbi:MAG: hypothetical protein IPK74_07060 [Deltaproteobacteria bacterium]|nr:hypothetical protein [Deltaproteobacteria bacterium]